MNYDDSSTSESESETESEGQVEPESEGEVGGTGVTYITNYALDKFKKQENQLRELEQELVSVKGENQSYYLDMKYHEHDAYEKYRENRRLKEEIDELKKRHVDDMVSNQMRHSREKEALEDKLKKQHVKAIMGQMERHLEEVDIATKLIYELEDKLMEMKIEKIKHHQAGL